MDEKTRNVSGSLCPAMASADILGDKWTLLLLREMFLGTTRFGGFQKAIPRMSPSILSKRLKTLEAAEIIVRKPFPTAQAGEYRLTRSGRELGRLWKTWRSGGCAGANAVSPHRTAMSAGSCGISTAP
jgi:DNA-binding HxlR family transcriptional regulator